MITVPSTQINVEATTQSGTTVTFTATATDDVDGTVQVTCDPPSGSTFKVGDTTVTCKATEKAGNMAEKTFSITVLAAPTPAALTPEPKVIVIVVIVQGNQHDLNVETSTVTDLQVDEKDDQISFKVSGPSGTPGFTIIPEAKYCKSPTL